MRLERVLTDFGCEHSFLHAAARVREHYGFEIRAKQRRFTPPPLVMSMKWADDGATVPGVRVGDSTAKFTLWAMGPNGSAYRPGKSLGGREASCAISFMSASIWERLRPLVRPRLRSGGAEPNRIGSSEERWRKSSKHWLSIWKRPTHWKRTPPCAMGTVI